MSKNNHKIAINILNRINFDDVTLMRKLLYLIAEHNPHSIIKADISLTLPADAIDKDVETAQILCDFYKKNGSKILAIKQLRTDRNLGLREAKDLIDRFWKA